ncbi:MAG: sigma-54 dependent transcriptional regulator [Candidatus Marinimicrobia bacterium]|nr:sigma-54 dependent transcriptional regulator [Candidatus Neomarinimicrobiota bacterium]MCF7841073.1 sigma-54 dependent transcriptional regulator [Candidatus Neomarinimicrobiota bacterium]MCF7902290.1 sigma-54 dependent transcriptional regulator [Candidatus Neomarinimicrobiota bacterium]
MRAILSESLQAMGYETQEAKDGVHAMEILETQTFDLVVTDLKMPRMDGVELMSTTLKKYPNTGFLIMTAYGTIETAVDALQTGAFDFLTKPFSISQFGTRVKRFFEFTDLQQVNQGLRRKINSLQRSKKIIGQSPAFLKILEQIDVVAKSDVPVLIQGESGTGKELVASSIHESSARADKPFLKINCSAIPETLVESILFGHEKGAFTNAVSTRQGLFEEANDGTLLLDEISEMPIHLQAKLLRVLQEQTLTRVGSSKETSVDVRIIATTNRNIEELIAEGGFRSDLYYRLNVFPITIPPIRERRDDIQLLVRHFLEIFRKKYKFEGKEVSEKSWEIILEYDWPGNVREIENLVERAFLYSGNDTQLKTSHFHFQPIQSNPKPNGQLEIGAVSMADVEKHVIFKTLELCEDNRTKTADILGITSRTLRNKLSQYKLDN